MNSSEQQLLFHYKKIVALADKALTKAYITLLIFGYISYTQPQISKPTGDLLLHNWFITGRCADPIPSSRIRQTIIDRVFNGTSPFQNFPRLACVSSHPLQRANKKSSIFEDLIRQVRPETIIQVGTSQLGESATHMAGLTRRLGLDTQILCIDDIRIRSIYRFMKNVVRANVMGSIMFVPFSSGRGLGGLCEWGVSGDLVEVDGDKEFIEAWKDINNSYKVLRPGGVIFGHGYVWVGVRNAVHLFARLNRFRVRTDGDHWILY